MNKTCTFQIIETITMLKSSAASRPVVPDERAQRPMPSRTREAQAMRRLGTRFAKVKENYWMRVSAFRTWDNAANGPGLCVFESREAALVWEAALPEEAKGQRPHYTAEPHCVLPLEQAKLLKAWRAAQKKAGARAAHEEDYKAKYFEMCEILQSKNQEMNELKEELNLWKRRAWSKADRCRKLRDSIEISRKETEEQECTHFQDRISYLIN